ncbi:hypothetical protein VPH35_091540 [Triticum aestivum]
MPSASRASSSQSSAAATLGRLPLSSGVASPPLYVRRRPSAPSYLSPSRRCSRPQGEKAIKARYRLHPRRRRIARTAEMPCRRAPFRRSPSTRLADEGRSNRSMVGMEQRGRRPRRRMPHGLCNFGVNKSA